MTLHAEFDRLRTFLGALGHLTPKEQKDAFMNEAIENGGFYMPPEHGGWGDHMFTINLHGVSAFGSNEEEAIRSWKMAAQAQIAHQAA